MTEPSEPGDSEQGHHEFGADAEGAKAAFLDRDSLSDAQTVSRLIRECLEDPVDVLTAVRIVGAVDRKVVLTDQSALLSCAAAHAAAGDHKAACELLSEGVGFVRTLPVLSELAQMQFRLRRYDDFLGSAMEILSVSPWRHSLLKKVISAHLERKDFTAAAFYSQVLGLIGYASSLESKLANDAPTGGEVPAGSLQTAQCRSAEQIVEAIWRQRIPRFEYPQAFAASSLKDDSRFSALGYKRYNQGEALINNIGDEIQSLAALRFSGPVRAFLNRDELASADSPTKIILNGWFAHPVDAPAYSKQQKYSWPPHPTLQPLFVSFHLSERAAPFFLDKRGVRYLRQHGPIGCRDLSTLKLLQSAKLDAYFSGCLTLTLPERSAADVNGSVVLSDVPHGLLPQIEEVVRSKLSHCVIYSTHASAALARSQKERFAIAQAYLDTYGKAAFVVTTRLHAALPCIAMGVPVLLVVKDPNDPRFAGLLPLVSWERAEDLVSSPERILQHATVVRRDHESIREQLIARVAEFCSGN